MKNKKNIFLLLAISSLLIISMGLIDKKQKRLQSVFPPSNGFAVLEFFVSEGCRKCPAAGEVMERIVENNTNDHLYVLGYHIDYWDLRGWKDQFADPVFSARQHQYAKWLNNYVYTPQVVINGKEELLGSDENTIFKLASRELTTPMENLLSLKAVVKKNEIQINYSYSHSNESLDLIVLLVQKNGYSEVKKGQNSGKRLNHVQIVRALKKASLRDETTRLPIPDNIDLEHAEVIGLVQNNQNGEIKSAARFVLN